MVLAVCDDEKIIRDIIEKHALSVCDSLRIHQYESAEDILAYGLAADIIFLDIKMPGINGMDAARRLREKGCKAVIVFVTAVEEYVFDAFDVDAIGYIVKPFDDKKLEAVIEKAVSIVKEQREAKKASAQTRNRRRSIIVKGAAGTTKVFLSDITYAEIYDRRMVLHIKDKSTVEYYGRMTELEGIAGSDFFRVHRAFLVNLAYIRSYDSKNVFIQGMDIPVARGKYRELVKAFISYHTRRECL